MTVRVFPFLGLFMMVLGVLVWFMIELRLGSDVLPGPIVTLNLSSLGMAEFADINSPLYANISALLPVNISASDYASITKYLGVADWYVIYLRGYCTGYYYAYDWPVASLNNYIEVEQDGNCTKYDGVQSYRFDLHSILVQSLPPSVEGLAHPYRNITILNVATWQICWCIGAAFWPLVMVSLYLTLYGTRRLNGIALLLSLGLFASIMCSLSFMLGNLLQLPRESWVHVSSFQYHLSLYFFIPVVFLTFCEWKLQQWTHYLDDIVIDRKPDGVSWWSHNPPPNTYVTDPEILLRPMGGNFNPQSQQDRAVESGMRLDSWARGWIKDNRFGIPMNVGGDYRIFPPARDVNQGQAS